MKCKHCKENINFFAWCIREKCCFFCWEAVLQLELEEEKILLKQELEHHNQQKIELQQKIEERKKLIKEKKK